MPTRPKLAPAWDLTHNYLLARNLIRVANLLFEIRRDTVIFSGYIYEKANSPFKIRIYHKAKFIKEVALHHLGYGGVLHIEAITQNIESAMRFDLLGALQVPGSGQKPIGLSVG